jgi:hypothetical protein
MDLLLGGGDSVGFDIKIDIHLLLRIIRQIVIILLVPIRGGVILSKIPQGSALSDWTGFLAIESWYSNHWARDSVGDLNQRCGHLLGPVL